MKDQVADCGNDVRWCEGLIEALQIVMEDLEKYAGEYEDQVRGEMQEIQGLVAQANTRLRTLRDGFREE